MRCLLVFTSDVILFIYMPKVCIPIAKRTLWKLFRTVTIPNWPSQVSGPGAWPKSVVDATKDFAEHRLGTWRITRKNHFHENQRDGVVLGSLYLSKERAIHISDDRNTFRIGTSVAIATSSWYFL